MKKENIFDLYAEQHKDDQEPNTDRVPGEVTPEDVAREPEQKADPEPEQKADPEPEQKADPEPEQKAGGET